MEILARFLHCLAILVYLGWVVPLSYGLNVLDQVHERGEGAVRLKRLPLVEKGVDEVGIVVEIMSETGVGDLQDHLENLLHYRLVCCLGDWSATGHMTSQVMGM